jgi:RND family efflux transporter MFP subunit
VLLGLATDAGYPHRGILDFAESGVDPETGTIKLRGVFENDAKPELLIPGLFGRVRVPVGRRPDMTLVVDRATGADQSGQYVLVVNADDVVEKRNVELGQLIDGLRVIESGVGADDRVVVNGIQRARPGGKVDPESVDMASLKLSATAGGDAAAAAQTETDDADSEPAASPPAATEP